ncbi:hypothetical protein D3C80_1805900 [compost metagenome]
MARAAQPPLSARKKKIQVLEDDAPQQSNPEDDMTVEQYLRSECQKQIERINEHVDRLVEKLQDDAKMQRLHLSKLMHDLEQEDEDE